MSQAGGDEITVNPAPPPLRFLLNTFSALKAVARHAELGGERLEGGDGALDGMDEEQGSLLALDLVEWSHRGAVGVDQQLGQIRFQHGADAVPLRRGVVRFWKWRKTNSLYSVWCECSRRFGGEKAACSPSYRCFLLVWTALAAC